VDCKECGGSGICEHGEPGRLSARSVGEQDM
jgi:hypothetical protein